MTTAALRPGTRVRVVSLLVDSMVAGRVGTVVVAPGPPAPGVKWEVWVRVANLPPRGFAAAELEVLP